MSNLVLIGFNLSGEAEKVRLDLEIALREVGEDAFIGTNVVEISNAKSYPLAHSEQRTPYIVIEGDNPVEMESIGTAINRLGYDVQISQPLLKFMGKSS